MSEVNKCFFCDKEGSEKCPDCDLIWFCDKSHFRFHKSFNGGVCQPFTVVYGGEEIGRFLKATRDIKPFEIIVMDRVAGLGVFDDSKPVCLSCLNRITETGSIPCPFCRMPLCNKEECIGSELHKPECEILRHYPDDKKLVDKTLEDIHPVYALIGPLRILRWRSDPIEWKEIVSLASHFQERKQDFRWAWVVDKVLPIAKECGMSQDEIDDLELLFAIARTNALSLFKTVGESPGYGLCPLFSLINHSCMANCRYDISGDNSYVTVRAARPIKTGEELTIQYKDPLVGNVSSALSFKNHWMFTCGCKRCSDPTECGTYLSAVKCQADEKCSGFLLPQNSLDVDSIWTCTVSDSEHPNVEANKIREAVERLKFQVDKLTYRDSVEDWETLLQRLLQNLHPNHFLVMNAKRMLIQLYGTQVKFDDMSEATMKLVNRKLELCQEFLEVYQKVDFGYSKWKGRIMEEMSTPFIMSRLQKYKNGEIDHAQYVKSYLEAVRMLKEAAKCRQYDTRDNTDSLFAIYIRNFNDAIEKFAA